MVTVTVGVDVGQRVDPTAIAVVEAVRRPGPSGAEVHHLVRLLERLPLGTPYPAVAERLHAVVAGLRARIPPSALSLTVYVDATGVGLPVCDVLAAGGLAVTPCFFTFGDKRTIREDRSVSVGKAWLVSQLQALLQTVRLHLPKTSEAEALADELRVYEIRADPDGDAKFGAFKVGTHDDLVTALGLAVQPTPALQIFLDRSPGEPVPAPRRTGWDDVGWR